MTPCKQCLSQQKFGFCPSGFVGLHIFSSLLFGQFVHLSLLKNELCLLQLLRNILRSKRLFSLTKSSGIPVKTISPPYFPAFGPTSMMWSAHLIISAGAQSQLQNVLILSMPESFSNFWISWKCKPVEGSSNTNKVFPLSHLLQGKITNLTLCASPPKE